MANLDNVQAIIARSSAKPFVSVVLFRLHAPAPAKTFLRRWTPRAPAGMAEETPGVAALHFLFSWKAIRQLLEGHPELDPAKGRDELEVFFVDPSEGPGSTALAGSLGLVGRNAPDGWWQHRFTSDDVDIAIHVSADDEAQRDEVLADLRASAADVGLEELRLDAPFDGALTGMRPPGGILHFGYRDGITAPAVDWADGGAAGMVDCREFVLGYPSEAYATSPSLPGAWQDFGRDGSYVGLCWLHQDVAAFNRFLRANAEHAPAAVPPALAEEWVAAKLMGRWRNGSPLIRHPDAPPSPPELDDRFGYAGDPDGLRCPFGAHIRVVNLRDDPMTFPNQVRFPKGPPRFIRRGFSYGPPLDGVDDDGRERGLVGLFCFARINEQFYTILRWMQRTEFSDTFDRIPGGAAGQDAVTGPRAVPTANTTFHVPRAGTDPARMQLADFIRYRGVVVLLAPSITALTTLARD